MAEAPPWSWLAASVGVRACIPIVFKLLAHSGLPMVVALLLAAPLLALQALVWARTLRHYDLGFAYPFLGTHLIVVLGVGLLCYDERLTLSNAIGTGLILAGIGLLIIGRPQQSVA